MEEQFRPIPSYTHPDWRPIVYRRLHWLRDSTSATTFTERAALVFGELLDDQKAVDIFMCSTKDLSVLSSFTSRTAVERGVHAIRTLIADLFFYYNHRQQRDVDIWRTSRMILNGFSKNEGFLGLDIAARIAEELAQLPVMVHKDSSNIVAYNRSTMPACFSAVFGEDPLDGLTPIMRAVFEFLGLPFDHPDAVMQFKENTFGQRVRNEPNDGDIQKNFHTDTFFHAIKFWYFPREVRLEHGPLRLAVGSNTLSYHRLDYMQNEYMKLVFNEPIDPSFDRGHSEGSLRITPGMINELGYIIQDMVVPADTLVVGDVFSWHARGHAFEPSDRLAIHGSIRLKYPMGQW